MKCFDALADPTRRRILELLVDGERTAGDLSDLVARQYGLSQPATSRHLRVLREASLVRSRTDGPSRIYSLDADGLSEVALWLDQFRSLWSRALSSLADEIDRGKEQHP